MVGNIVGLDDSHAENILINERAGGWAHVDFNCIFDKAKTLPLILTQNIGIRALESSGNIAASARIIVEVLRSKRQKLVSVLQPFVHDPLLEWKESVVKELIKQAG